MVPVVGPSLYRLFRLQRPSKNDATPLGGDFVAHPTSDLYLQLWGC
jgi:hypothetical protein